MAFVKLPWFLQVDIKRSVEGGEKRFNKLSIEERGKFDEETLVNVNNIRRHKSTRRSSSFSNEYIVVCISCQLITYIKVSSFSNFSRGSTNRLFSGSSVAPFVFWQRWYIVLTCFISNEARCVTSLICLKIYNFPITSLSHHL
jgi:Protein of unknown function (DUF1517)